MPICKECGFKAVRLQWSHFKYKCTGRFNNGREYMAAYPDADIIDPELKLKTAVTLQNLITKYGQEEGEKKWDVYCEKQAITNSFAYKQEKYGWTKDKFDEYNKSPAVTLQNLITKYGQEEGEKKWDVYCERQSYTNSESYFINKYGKEEGSNEFLRICKAKGHSIDNIMQRKQCTKDEAILHRELMKNGSKNYSLLEKQIISEIEQLLGKSLQYTINTKQYCVWANNKPNFYDIVHNDRSIEINGDYWHCNPNLYLPNFCHPHSGLLAKNIWANDKLKHTALVEKRNIPILIIWEQDYRLHPKHTIERGVKWLTQNDNE